jgi:hypothetical protein
MVLSGRGRALPRAAALALRAVVDVRCLDVRCGSK